MRRNIALLKALQRKADIIITIDDDNFPIDNNYFSDMQNTILNSNSGICFESSKKFLDIGVFIGNGVSHRGVPLSVHQEKQTISAVIKNQRKIAIAAGLWYGHADIDAFARLKSEKLIFEYNSLLCHGIVVNNSNYTVFNSQNTGLSKEIAAACPVLIDVGRYDDIWMSLVAQKIMRQNDLHVHFGKPFVWQQRNKQSSIQNLKDELHGMDFTKTLINDLRKIKICNDSPQNNLEKIFTDLKNKKYITKNLISMIREWSKQVNKI